VGAHAPATELIAGFVPESELERRLAADPLLLRGLAWGAPRASHPEGSVANHVADLLATIDAWGEIEPRRGELRVITLVHDGLKFKVRDYLPHAGPNHHAARARRHAERYVDDERLLATIELHDRPYSLWRRMRRSGSLDERGFTRLVERVPDLDLFVRFVELDGSTEGKDPEPTAWLKDELGRRALAP
jgi:hypothetical protein